MSVVSQGAKAPPSTMGIRVGDTVTIRPCFGLGEPQEITVTGLEITKERRSKYGTPVQAAAWSIVIANRVLIEYDGHWCYSDQVVLPKWETR